VSPRVLTPDVDSFHRRRNATSLLKRWLRSLVGRDVFQRRQCRVAGEVLGNRHGSWFVATGRLSSAPVVYSFGVGRDLSFECALIDRFGATVHAFDPTPLALEWARTQPLPDRLMLRKLGVADYDGTARFLPSRRAGGENFSMIRTSGIGDPIEAPVRRFATLAALTGAVPELVKLDIEGTEYAVLPDMLASGFRPRYRRKARSTPSCCSPEPPPAPPYLTASRTTRPAWSDGQMSPAAPATRSAGSSPMRWMRQLTSPCRRSSRSST